MVEHTCPGGQTRAATEAQRQMTSYEELYEKYATDVLRVSYFYLGDHQRAEDVCQDVFVRLITNAPNLEEGREKAWLLKVALNRCRDLWRGAWVKRVVLGSPAFEMIPAPDDTERREDEEIVMKAVHSLPAAFRTAPAGIASQETTRTALPSSCAASISKIRIPSCSFA